MGEWGFSHARTYKPGVEIMSVGCVACWLNCVFPLPCRLLLGSGPLAGLWGRAEAVSQAGGVPCHIGQLGASSWPRVGSRSPNGPITRLARSAAHTTRYPVMSPGQRYSGKQHLQLGLQRIGCPAKLPVPASRISTMIPSRPTTRRPLNPYQNPYQREPLATTASTDQREH